MGVDPTIGGDMSPILLKVYIFNTLIRLTM